MGWLGAKRERVSHTGGGNVPTGKIGGVAEYSNKNKSEKGNKEKVGGTHSYIKTTK